jgi:hypothetical protein
VGPIPTHPESESLLFPYLSAHIPELIERAILAVNYPFQKPRIVPKTSTYDKVRVKSDFFLVFEPESGLSISPSIDED